MAAIVAGGSVGLLQSSAALLGGAGQLGAATHGRAGERVYVNAATGNLVIQGQDELLIGRGPDAAVLRTYNSQGLLDDDNGDNWRLGFHRRVLGLAGTLNAAGSTVKRIDADGAEALYTYDTTLGKYVTSEGSGAYDTLSHSGGTWTFADGDSGVIETYDAANGGRLTSVTDESGNAMAFGYNGAGLLVSVQTASGETTYLDYAGNNLTQVRTVASGGATLIRTSYAYDGWNRLTQVTTDLTPQNSADAKTYVTSYTYDGTSRRVASMTQSDGTSLAFVYAEIGGAYRVTQITDALGRATSIAYNTGARTTAVTDALGQATVLAYDTSSRLTGITMPAAGGAPAQQVSYAYDAAGNVTSVTDARGNAVVYGYDARGNRMHEHDSAGNTVDRVYGSKNELLSETRAGTLTARYIYDASTRLRFEVSAAGRVTEHRYNGFGQRVSTIEYTAATYSTAGTPTEAQMAAWLPADRSKSVRVDTAYNFRGQAASVTTYGAVDSGGNGIAAGQSVTQFVYDQAGNLLQTIDARSFQTSSVYDGFGRVLSTTDALGRLTLTDYQDATRRTVVTLANGLVRASTYSAAGELISLLESAGGPTLGETKYFYDANGRLRRTEDPTGVTAHILYDAAGRKVGEVDGDGSLTEFRYDANNNLARTIHYANAVSGAVTDASTLAAIRPAAHAADRSTWHAYDSANRLVKSVDGRGFVTQNFYDGAGQLTDVVQFATAIATAALGDTPAASAIAPASSTADRLTRSFYDADGKRRGELDGEGYLVEYKYDAAGQLVETVGYATATSAALRATGTLEQLRPAADAADIHSFTLYNARGESAATVDGEGYLTETVYDAAGNKTQVIRYATPVTYVAGATLASLRPSSTAQDQVGTFAYDGLDRVASETNAEGTVTQYTYDEVGNLIRTVKAANTADVRTLNAQYDKQGRLTAELSGNGSALLTGSQSQAEIDAIWAQHAIKHAYDAAGRRTSSTDALSYRTLFYYDADGRLAYTVNALGEVKRSIYNSLGELVQSIQYGTRLPAATLSALGGGLVSTALENAITVFAIPTSNTATGYAYDASGNLRQITDALGFVESLTYDAFGQVASRSQPIAGGQTLDHTYAYDRRGLLTHTVWDPAGLNTSTAMQYDAFGRAVQTTDANGNQRSASYDKLGRTISTQDALNATRSSTYDAFGRVLTQTDALGHTTTFAYDTAARAVTMTTAEGVVTTLVSNRHGQELSVTDGRGNVTTYQYDKNGNLTRADSPDAGFTTRSYDGADRLIETVDARGAHTTYTYDAAGRNLTRTFDPGGLALTTRYAYDAKGQAVSAFDANGVETRTEFDVKGQATSVTVDPHGLALKTAYSYDRRGKTLTVTEGAGSAQPRVTQYEYDKLGRRTAERRDPAGLNLVSSYAYDKNDNVVAKTTPNGYITRYVYDAEKNLVYTIDPLGAVLRTDYDANGRAVGTTMYANGLITGALPASPTPASIAALIVADAARDRVTRLVRDDDGRDVYSIDALGGVRQKIYDANGNVVRTIAYATPIPAATLPAEAAVQAALQTSAQDQVARIFYDAANRPIYSIDASGAVAETVYDAGSNAIRTRAYAGVQVSGEVTQAELQGLLVTSAADRLVRKVYDAANRLVFTIDAGNFVRETRYDNVGRVTQTVAYPNAVTVSAAPTIAEVRAALGLPNLASYSNVTGTQSTAPSQPYPYLESTSDVLATPGVQTVAVSSATETVSSLQPYSYIASAKADSTGSATQNVSLSVQNTTVTQSANVVNHAWNRSGTSIVQVGGISITPGSITFGDNTPVGVLAKLYQNGSLISQISTDVGYQSGESWSVYSHTLPYYHHSYPNIYNYSPTWTDPFWGVTESGQVVDYHDFNRPAYGTRWNPVSGWSGQVNLSTGSLAAGHYSVVVETWDNATNGQVENGFYDTDGTWSYSNTIEVNVGTVVNPTYVRWATSTQPAGTSTVTLKYRAAGSTGAYSNATVGVNGANHEANLGNLASGNYEYVVEYRDSYGRVLKSASGTLTTTAGQTTSASAAFNYTTYSSSAAAGSSIRYFTQASQWAPVDHITATVKDSAGNVVATAVTYPEAESGYNGEVNLKTGAALADGAYTVELTLHNKDGSTTTVTPFAYEAGAATRLKQTITWASSTQPAGTTASFKYRTQGSSGSWTSASVAAQGANHRMALDWIAAGTYEYTVEYRDSSNYVVKSAAGTFAVAGPSSSNITDVGFAYLAYSSAARDDVATPGVQTVAVSSATETVSSLQPYSYIASAKADSTGSATQNVSLSVQNTTVTQSANVANFAWNRSGSSIYQVGGLSITSGSITFGDNTPVGVLAKLYQNGSLISQISTDVGYQSGESWSVYSHTLPYYHHSYPNIYNYSPTWTDPFWGVTESGQVVDYHDFNRPAYGTRWNPVSGWSGQVNLSTGSLAAGHYSVVVETWDNATNGQVENGFYDADGTWSYSNTIEVNVGTVVNPTYVRWAASTQPAGTSTVTLKYRAAGSTGAYSNATVGVNGANHEANLGNLAAGNYEYIVEYRDSYGRVLKSASGTLTTTAGQTTSASAAFNYTTYSSSAAAGSSIRYFTAPSQWAPVDHITATVKDSAGNVVATAVTYPEAESGYNGEVNLKTGAALADGAYTVELTLHNKDGSTTTVTPFAYEAGAATRLKQTITWASSTQPAGTTTHFKYRPQGSAGSWTSASVGSAGSDRQAVADWLVAGNYEYAVEYRDSYDRVVKSAAGTFDASASSTVGLDFAYTSYSSTASAGSSIAGYIGSGLAPTIERVEATVKTVNGATVSSAVTYPELWPDYAGNVNLSVGEVLPDGHYNVTVTVFKKDGTSSSNTFVYEVGTQDYLQRTTTVSWSAANQPAGTTVEFVYKRAGQSGETVVTPTLASGSYSAAFTFNADDGVQTGLAEGIYDFTVRYKAGATVVLEGKGQFTAQAGGGGMSAISFAPVAQQTETFAYDSAGRLIQSTDARGFSESRAYDAAGNKSSNTDARGFTTSYVYDAAGRTSFTVDAAGYVTQLTYDGDGNVIKEVRYANALQGAVSANPLSQIVLDPAKDHVLRSVYDGAGRMRYGVDGEGYVTERRLDAFGQETGRVRYADKITVGEGATLASMAGLLPATAPASAALEEAHFDVAGRAIELIDGEGSVTRTTYDLFGRKTEVTRAYGTAAASTTRYAYDILGRVQEEIRAYGTSEAATTRYTVDVFGNRTRIVEARGVELAETDSLWALATRKALGYIDGGGNARLAAALTTAEKDGLRAFYATTQQFDVRGLRTRSTDPVGGATETAYDAFGNAVKIVDPRGNAGYFYFDQRNEAVLHVDPEGYATRTFYDGAGNVEKTVRYATRVSGTITAGEQPAIVADAVRDQVTLNEYDGRNLKTRVVDGEGAEELYAYSAFGKKASHTNQLGGVTIYGYDRAGNLVSETLPVGGVVNKYEHDARGNRTRQIEAFGLPEARTTDFQFDKLDRQVAKTGQAVHVFDPLTNTATGTATPVEVTRYDARGNAIETIAANGARTLTYYDALDRKIAEIGPLGALTVWQYNDGKAPIGELRYGDPVALPAIAGGVAPAPVNAANVREKRFTYDANNALVETRIPQVLLGEQAAGASAFGSFVQDVVAKSIHDAAGNEVQSIDGRGNSTFRYYDKLGQKVLEVDAERQVTRFEHDAAGNVVRETRYANKLTLTPTIVSDVAALIADVSGGSGHRVTEQDYDRMGRVVERRVLAVETGSVATSNGALTATTANARTQLQYNGLGQVVRQIDATGAVSDIAYDAAGRKTQEQGAQYTDFEGALVRPTTDYEYDGLNQVKREIGRGKNAASETDDRITLYQYDYGYGARLIAQTGAYGTPNAATAGFAYDVAGRIASRSMVRTNADGASATDRTNYGYDFLDREVLRQDLGASQTNETRYNLYGELTGKRTNGGGAGAAWQEFAEYDALGRVWKSNSGDGVTKVYLYDANGNSTLTIQSAGPDLSGMTLDQVVELPGSSKYMTITQYDARNQVIDIYQPKMNAGHDFGSIEQFITQKAGVSFSGGAVSVGAIWGVTTKPTQTPAVPGAVAISRATTQSATLTLRYSYGGGGTGLFNSPYSTLYVSVPDTSATLGTGNYHAVIYLNDIYGNGAFLPGIGTGWGITPNYYAEHSTSLAFNFAEWGSWPNNGFNPPFWRNYSYALYKQTPYGEVYLGSYGGSTSGAAEEPVYDESGNLTGYQIANWPNPYGNTNSSFTFGLNEVAFRGQSPQANRLILQSRIAGSGSGWATTSVPEKFAGAGWFALDWSGWAHNTYEIRYTTLDAAGNVLNSQDGTMVLNGSSPSISQSTRQIGGVGRVFMAADGKLHILEQGANAQSVTVRYRQAGSSAPLSSVTLNPASVGGAATPGWFIFDTAGLSGNYEYFIEAKNAGGASLNKGVGTFTAGSADSVTLGAYQDLPEMVHFTAQQLSAVSMKISYRLSGTQSWSTVWAEKVGFGAFDWNATGLVIDRFADYNYEFEYEAFDASNARVNKARGEIRVGISAAVITPHENEVAPPEVRFSPPQAEARKLVLYYRDTASSGAYDTRTLTRPNGTDAFVWDVEALVTPGSVANFDYYYDLFDGADAPLINPNGVEIRVEGAVTVGDATPARELKWVVVGSSNSDWSIHRQQTHNAFGEIASEIDGLGRVTDFRHNNLGLLVEKLDPETDITLANGFIQRGRPATGYTYDLAGRLIAVRDANGNVSTQALLPGAGLDGRAPKVLTEFHADGGRKLTMYDVFGDSRVLTDEIGRITLQEYDKLGRLTRVVHPQRAAGTPGNETGAAVAAVDEFSYDQAGNRIKHTTTNTNPSALGKTEKAYYDSQGRVTQTTSFAGIATAYSYLYQSTIAGAGGVQVGGWLKTTTDGTGRTLKDQQDIFGRTTWHEDLGGRQSTYNYNHAGWLASQTSTAGQNIAYEYYANGYLKKINDLATGARSTYEYDAEGNRTLEAYSRLIGGTPEFYQHSVVTYDELNRVKQIIDPKYNIRYEYDANNNRRRVWSYYHDGIDGSQQVQDFWYLYDSMNRFTLTMGRLSSGVPSTYDTDSLRGTSATDTSVSLVKGSTGIEIGYDAASQRRMALHGSDGHREDYTYTADGYLEDTLISMDGSPANSVLRARQFHDVLGRVVKYQEYSTAASPTSGRTSQYNDDSKVMVQTEYTGAVGGTVASTTTSDYVDAAGTNNNAGALAMTSSVAGSTTTNTYYNYQYWDSAKERDITLQPYNEQAPGWKPGNSHFEYDVNGNVQSVNDPMGGRSMRYVNDAQGQIMTRDEIGGGSANAQGVVTGGTNVNQRHSFFYVNGNRIGDLGNDGPSRVSYAESLARDKTVSREERYRNWRPIATADFDQNYEPISESYPGASASSYTVRGGETLQAIARSVWGDASMWYLIADANGLTGAAALTAGQTLTIPNKVTNIHNTSETYRVYSAGEAIGDTAPTLPDAPPPPPPAGGGKGCGGVGMIILIVVIIVATIMTAGAAAVAMAGGMSALGGAGLAGIAAAGMGTIAATGSVAIGLAAAAIGGAVGSMVGQGIMMATGHQESFSWNQVGASAVGSMIGAGVSAAAGPAQSAWHAAGTAMAANVATQGVGMVTGAQEKFDWRSVAVSGMASYAGYEMGQFIQTDGVYDEAGNLTRRVPSAFSNQVGASAARATSGLAAGVTSQLVRRAVYGEGRLDYASLAGSMMGQSLVDELSAYHTERTLQAREDARDRAVLDAMNAASPSPTWASPDYSLQPEGGSVRLPTIYGSNTNGQGDADFDPMSGQNGKAIPDGLHASEVPQPAGFMQVNEDSGDMVGARPDRRYEFDNDDRDHRAVTGRRMMREPVQVDPLSTESLSRRKAATLEELAQWGARTRPGGPEEALAATTIGLADLLLPGSSLEAGLIVGGPAVARAGGWGLRQLNKLPILGLDVVEAGSQWASRLAAREAFEAGERIAYKELSSLEKSVADAHFLRRHGPETTLEQQQIRAGGGATPDGKPPIPGGVDSSRWLSHGDMVEGLGRARAIYARTGDSVVTVEFNRIIGEGYLKGGEIYARSNVAMFRFNRSGEPYTFYPLLDVK